ncbi:sigma-54 dependent transcriptional regulator [Stenotrophomonas sp. SY1]|jgi:DNA-binding NtrC family response regulator|uniref:sigma-54 interaction domain-containing protein n=1 Tax=Stenotrophomonas sp. SY1 TaxID=477235 RepID=UPI001E3893CB|nr:sigma-54 dependent transcriptional regulator [Stenotrophomonas sp. SY1]MCD9086541.1 sigma-54 dependent transcriptional regulator [Stenotrophomonas sp. SY1]
MATPDSDKRCVIWFGKPGTREKVMLAADGWQLRAVLPQQPAEIGMRGGDVVVGLIDFRNSSDSELERIEKLTAEHRHMPLFAITGDNQAPHPLLAACLQQFPHPPDLKELLHHLQALAGPSATPVADEALDTLLGESEVMLVMRATLRKFAPVDLPVLITGETGTGKEAAAHALHRLSPRHVKPFQAVNCGAIPATLVQSELFGHERGAFTGATSRRQGLFETAHTGTVFLDEVGDLPLDAQTSLLRVLQEGTLERVGSNQPIRVDVRILAATHVDLERAVEEGRFRRDLYYRLNVLRLPMPPLRKRDGDIDLLARHFLADFRSRHRIRARGYSSEARQAMARFQWPGNVRELLNRVQRAAITAEGELISCADLELAGNGAANRNQLEHVRTHAEREALLSYLQQSRYNISACARLMKVSRVTIYRLCRKHQLELGTLR